MPPLAAAEIHGRIAALIPDAVTEFVDAGAAIPGAKDPAREAWIRVKPERWHDVARALRDDPDLRFDYLQNVTAVDWPKRNVIELVYHLFSYAHLHSLAVKADLPRDNPLIPSVTDLWPSADWNEREQFDLLGVGFSNHPDLRRLLMPDDWVGYPMRKDYKEAADYRGMPTTRPSPLELLMVYDKAPAEKKGLGPAAEAPAAGGAAAAGGSHAGGHGDE